jgi:hypothetical protein
MDRALSLLPTLDASLQELALNYDVTGKQVADVAAGLPVVTYSRQISCCSR